MAAATSGEVHELTTGLMFSWALRVRSSRLFSWPGTVMTSWSAPSTCTCAPATPEPLTRRSMMSLAWFIASRDGVDPSAVRALSVILVPPWRSMPSFGVLEPGVKNTSAYRPIMMTRKVVISRQGWN